jgi:alpha-1,6-mannosyltransferase
VRNAQALDNAPLVPAFVKTLILTGSAYLAASIGLAVSQAPLGSIGFFALAAVMVACYAAVLLRVWRRPPPPSRLLLAAFTLALAFRAPLLVGPIGPDSDAMRYVWDGRVQHFGYNPYAVVPADPALAHTHTDDTRLMPSRRQRTPYPPAAQLFFRMVVGVRDSAHAMRLALAACDVLTILVVWRWLVVTGRSPWLTLAYAWNPLVVLEVAHSGHIDALGALWIAASAYWLARRRTALASIAFTLAVATKLLPVVLAPLYWRRIRLRDMLAGGVLFAALYATFVHDGRLPVGALPNVIAGIRFNGPLFMAIRLATIPEVAAGFALLLGLAAAAWARMRLPVDDPAAWAWPMALSLAAAPVIYPWYLVYFTPFLLSLSTVPLTVWTVSVLPVYIVWELAYRHGHVWVVPPSVIALEFALVIVAVAATTRLSSAWKRRGHAAIDVSERKT